MAHYNTSKKIKKQEKDIFGDWSEFEYIPVMNKCDLPGADPEMAELQVAVTLGLESKKGAVHCSAKTGLGIETLFKRIISDIPHPKHMDWGYSKYLESKEELRCFVFDSWYEPNKGVFFLVRVFNGTITVGDKVSVSKMVESKQLEVREVGIMNPNKFELNSLFKG
jgi:GTP-binding protein LepA